MHDLYPLCFVEMSANCYVAARASRGDNRCICIIDLPDFSFCNKGRCFTVFYLKFTATSATCSCLLHFHILDIRNCPEYFPGFPLDALPFEEMAGIVIGDTDLCTLFLSSGSQYMCLPMYSETSRTFEASRSAFSIISSPIGSPRSRSSRRIWGDILFSGRNRRWRSPQ